MFADELPEEAPEYHSIPMTPSSPKPVHVPAPSNIPILEFSENQMDQAYSEATQSHSSAMPTAAADTQANGVADEHATSHEQPAGNTAIMNDGAATSTANNEAPIVPNHTQGSADAPDNLSATPLAAEAQTQAQDAESLSASADQSQIPYDVGGVDIQAILDNLAAAVAAPQNADGLQPADDVARPEGPMAVEPLTNAPTPSTLAAKALSPHLSTQENPYAQALPQLDQPHSTSEQPFIGPPGASYKVSLLEAPSLTLAAAPGTDHTASSLPPPPLATFQHDVNAQIPHFPASATSKSDDGRNPDENIPWGPEIQRLYDEFLQEERRYVLEGKWDSFPVGSRLFIGNLPTERVTKRDLYHVFHKHGKLAQISIKQAYGFIQFLEREACQQAHRLEQNVSIRGKKVNLEISKPQRNTKGGGGGGGSGRNERGGQGRKRSRSPAHSKGDRYVGSGSRGRDHSPSSPSRRRRSPGRRRSRSRSPRRSSQAADDDDASLALPRRPPHTVPEVQIIAKDEPDRSFVQYVDAAFKARGVASDVLILSPRLNEPAVVRRQIIEGVLAVMKLDRSTMATQKYGLSIFDRSAGNGNVRFEEYADLDLPIAVELVLRARQTARPPQQVPLSQYGLPIVAPAPAPAPPHGFGHTAGPMQAFSPLPHGSGTSAPTNPLAGLDASTLQALLGTMGRGGPPPPQSHNGQSQGAAPGQDILALLGQLGKTQASSGAQSTGYGAQPPQSPSSAQGLPPALAALLAGTNGAGQTPSSQGQQSQGQHGLARGGGAQPDMSSIMAQLARYNGR